MPITSSSEADFFCWFQTASPIMTAAIMTPIMVSLVFAVCAMLHLKIYADCFCFKLEFEVEAELGHRNC